MQSIKFRVGVIATVKELKLRFRKVLGMYMEKKAQRDFEQMEMLINNFDQGDDYQVWSDKNKPKVLEAVIEDSDDELEQSITQQSVYMPKMGDKVLDFISK